MLCFARLLNGDVVSSNNLFNDRKHNTFRNNIVITTKKYIENHLLILSSIRVQWAFISDITYVMYQKADALSTPKFKFSIKSALAHYIFIRIHFPVFSPQN